jgi:Lar family restriction alleviation protein
METACAYTVESATFLWNRGVPPGMPTEEPRDCPFCGSEVIFRETQPPDDSDPIISLECNKCNFFSRPFRNEREAILWWNRRV